MKKGYFVTIEGCEGVGKSTQLNFLKEYLEKTGQEVYFTREPGGVAISEEIRKVILNPSFTEMTDKTEMLLYASSRAQLMAEQIIPKLDEGVTVICDRFIDSSYAYQGYARGLGIDNVRKINEYVVEGYMPDLTIFIDLSPDKSFRRKNNKVVLNDRLEKEDLSFHMKVYEGYKEAESISNGRIVSVVPCEDKMETFSKILNVMREKGIIK